MIRLSRRSFLTSSAVALSSALLTRGISFPGNTNPLHMLVVGDSVMWGQGLMGSKKYWYLTQRWLETELCRGRRVETHVEAHSGATIIDKNRTPKIDKLRKFYGEINIGTPTIQQQLKDAVRHYEDHRIVPGSVELILMNGGINDVGAFRLVDPRVTVAELKKEIDDACGTSMRALLAQATASFPNARIVVTGYYPIISEQSDTKYSCYLGKTIFGIDKYERILNAFLWLFGKRVSVCDAAFILRRLVAYKSQLVDLSETWYHYGNEKLEAAVAELNAASPLDGAGPFCGIQNPARSRQRAYFAPVRFGPENSFATSQESNAELNPSYLWQIVGVEKWPKTELDELLDKKNCSQLEPFRRKILSNDEMYDTRQAYCKCRDLEYAGLDLEMCHAAGTGHPNVKGAREFARAIRHALTGDPQHAAIVNRKPTHISTRRGDVLYAPAESV